MFVACSKRTSIDRGSAGVTDGIKSQAVADGENEPGAADYFRYRELLVSDEDRAQKYLIASAKKNYDDACYALATQKWIDDFDYTPFGSSRNNARINLLKECDPGNMAAKGFLARFYVEANEDVRNLKEARRLLRDLSEAGIKEYWLDYAKLCYEGEGGSVDYFEAYIYISADARSTHPESLKGIELWKLRERLAMKLSREDVKKALRVLDERRLHLADDAFLRGVVPEEVSDEGRRLVEQMEDIHRKAIDDR